MTSKEVVKEILKMITVMNRTELIFMTKDGVPVAQFKKEDVEQAEKDLEVLEILKKYYKGDGWSNGGVIEFWKMNNKQLSKITRWLYDDK